MKDTLQRKDLSQKQGFARDYLFKVPESPPPETLGCESLGIAGKKRTRKCSIS